MPIIQTTSTLINGRKNYIDHRKEKVEDYACHCTYQNPGKTARHFAKYLHLIRLPSLQFLRHTWKAPIERMTNHFSLNKYLK